MCYTFDMTSHTVTSPFTTPNKKIMPNSFSQPLFVVVLALVMLVSQCECRDTLLLASLNTKTDQILFRMLQETNYLFKSSRVINEKQLTCYSIGKNQLTSNHIQKTILLNHTISYKDILNKGASTTENKIKDEKLYKRLDSILDMLNGMCLFYRTTTFISQYCHKEHFRQFDDDYTKYYNQKQKFEDFYLGFYSPQSEIRAKLKQSDGLTAPAISTFAGIHFTPTVSDIIGFPRYLEFEENSEGKIVHASMHVIKSDSYIHYLPIFFQIKCLSHSEGIKRQVKNTMITVTPFDFVYTKKQGKCDDFINAMELQSKIPYEKDQKLRVYEQFLYGSVEQVCSHNWRWQGPAKDYQDAELKSGSTLSIEYAVVQGIEIVTKKQLVTVKHLHNYDLVELEQNLGISFSPKEIRKYLSKNKNYTIIQKIINCQILFDKPIIKSKLYADNIYLGNNLAILDKALPVSNESQNRIACVCCLNKQGFIHLIDMGIQTGNPIFLNYYRIYLQTKTFIYLYNNFKDVVFTQCQNIDCYHYNQNYAIKQAPQGQFTQISKVSKSNKVYKVRQKNDIYVLSIHQRGIIRLVTKDSKGNTYYYLLSEGQIIKMIHFENGTKQIIRENKYYENKTTVSEESINNYIFIYTFVLSDGTKYGGLWKYQDYLYFPRFQFLDQELVSFEYRQGYAYLRKINPDKVKHKDYLAILNYQKFIEKHYRQQREAQSQPTQQQIFLSESYSINYTYEGGDYCGPPINKQRTTLVTLKCGRPWFKIEKVHQTSPCSYFLQIQTLLLCKQNTRQVVESDEQIPRKAQNDKINFSGVTCIEQEGIFNRVSPFIYPGKKLLG